MGKPIKNKVDPAQGFKQVLLFAFGQKQMFDRPALGIMHFFIYAGFILINLEILEIIIDGILGTHRLFAPVLGSFYGVLIGFFEILALLVLISCLVFLVRRNLMSVSRFNKVEMAGWPKLDANLILAIEIILMLAILSLDAADLEAQKRNIAGYTQTQPFLISSMIQPFFTSWGDSGLVVAERSLWWFHIIGILAFAVYVTYSKHLHIFLSFPNIYYSSLGQSGKMENMDEVTNEVKIMLGTAQGGDAPPPESFGAKDFSDLSQKSLMDAFSCTECGRCTDECPANQTGKKLSPRKIMMDTRDRMEYHASKEKFVKGEKLLIRDHITEEEILACTSCQACVEACPVQINPLNIILELRRYLVMEESKSPQEWTAMMTNVENNFAPWAFPAADRFKWGRDLKEQTQ